MEILIETAIFVAEGGPSCVIPLRLAMSKPTHYLLSGSETKNAHGIKTISGSHAANAGETMYAAPSA